MVLIKEFQIPTGRRPRLMILTPPPLNFFGTQTLPPPGRRPRIYLTKLKKKMFPIPSPSKKPTFLFSCPTDRDQTLAKNKKAQPAWSDGKWLF